jgi:hypothetical protein
VGSNPTHATMRKIFEIMLREFTPHAIYDGYRPAIYSTYDESTDTFKTLPAYYLRIRNHEDLKSEELDNLVLQFEKKLGIKVLLDNDDAASIL